MKAKNQNNSLLKLVSLIGVASASVFLTLPALALINSSSSSFDSSLNKHNRRAESTGRSEQLLAQGTSGTSGTGATQNGTGGTGTNQNGTGSTGTNQNGTNQNGTGSTGTNQNGTSAGQTNGQQDAFTQSMNAGYAATQQRDYRTALTYFQRALELRPGNSFATQAINNVQSYLRRSTDTTPTIQGNP